MPSNILIPILVLVFTCVVYRWVFPKIDHLSLPAARVAIGWVEEDVYDGDDDGPAVVVSKRNRHVRFVKDAIHSVRAVMGLPTDNAANRLVVRKKLINAMEEHGMRLSHISAHIDLAIEAVFIPSENQVIARGVKNTSPVRDLISRYYGGSGRSLGSS